jgi:hypothetical protein
MVIGFPDLIRLAIARHLLLKEKESGGFAESFGGGGDSEAETTTT